MIDVWSKSVCETPPRATRGETTIAGTLIPYLHLLSHPAVLLAPILLYLPGFPRSGGNLIPGAWDRTSSLTRRLQSAAPFKSALPAQANNGPSSSGRSSSDLAPTASRHASAAPYDPLHGDRHPSRVRSVCGDQPPHALRNGVQVHVQNVSDGGASRNKVGADQVLVSSAG